MPYLNYPGSPLYQFNLSPNYSDRPTPIAPDSGYVPPDPKPIAPWDPGNGNEVAGKIGPGLDFQYSQWDQLIIGDSVLPGIVKLEGGKRCKLDVKHALGQNGADVSRMGMANGEILARITMWTEGQFDYMRRLLPSLIPVTVVGKMPPPVSVSHPALEALGITKLIVEHVDLPHVSSPGGPMEMTIRFLEHAPPVPVPIDTDRTAVSLDNKGRATTKPKPKPPKPSAVSSNAGP